MIGIYQKQDELWAKAVDLSSRIPEEHGLKRLEKVHDLGFVRDGVVGTYGKKGNVSIDPVVWMRLMLLLFIDNIRGERALMRVLPLRIDYLWFIGCGLYDEIPNHSVLSKARKRWGTAVFERLFGRVVLQCGEAGLVGSEEVHVDASLVRANASLNAMVQNIVEEQVAKLEDDADSEEDPRPPKHKPVNTTYRETDPDSRVVSHDGGKAHPKESPKVK